VGFLLFNCLETIEEIKQDDPVVLNLCFWYPTINTFS
jgi:hypothetical protein